MRPRGDASSFSGRITSCIPMLLAPHLIVRQGCAGVIYEGGKKKKKIAAALRFGQIKNMRCKCFQIGRIYFMDSSGKRNG